MRAVIAFLCLLVSSAYSFHYGGGGWGGPVVVSRRGAEGEGEASVTTLVSDIKDVLEQAKKGIKTDELESEAGEIKSAAQELSGAEGEDDEDVKTLIDDVATKFDGATAVSALFDGPLDFQSSKLDSALHLLDGLADKLQELSTSGEPVEDALAAIAMTADAIQDITEDVDEIFLLEAETQKEEGDEKRASLYRVRRGKWNAHLGYSGGGINGGVSYSWGKR